MGGVRYIGLGGRLKRLGSLVLSILSVPMVIMAILTILYFQDWKQITLLAIVSTLTISITMAGIGQVLCVYGRSKVSA